MRQNSLVISALLSSVQASPGSYRYECTTTPLAGAPADASAAYGPSSVDCWMYYDTTNQDILMDQPMAFEELNAPTWGDVDPSDFEADLADIEEEDTQLGRAGDMVFENETQERLQVFKIFKGQTQEHFARGIQPCFKFSTRSYDGMEFVVRNYRGYDGLQGKEYARAKAKPSNQNIKVTPEVSYLGTASCETLRARSPAKLIAHDGKRRIIFNNVSGDIVHILSVGFYGYADFKKTLNAGEQVTYNTGDQQQWYVTDRFGTKLGIFQGEYGTFQMDINPNPDQPGASDSNTVKIFREQKVDTSNEPIQIFTNESDEDVTVQSEDRQLFQLEPCEQKSTYSKVGEVFKVKDIVGNTIDTIKGKSGVNLLNIGLKDTVAISKCARSSDLVSSKQLTSFQTREQMTIRSEIKEVVNVWLENNDGKEQFFMILGGCGEETMQAGLDSIYVIRDIDGNFIEKIHGDKGTWTHTIRNKDSREIKQKCQVRNQLFDEMHKKSKVVWDKYQWVYPLVPDTVVSAFTGELAYQGQQYAVLTDYRKKDQPGEMNWKGMCSVYTTKLTDEDKTMTVRVSGEFTKEQADVLAKEYMHHVGQMPTQLRSYLYNVEMLDGSAAASGGGSNPAGKGTMTFHHVISQESIKLGTLGGWWMHEGCHISLFKHDFSFAYRWAQIQDGNFPTHAARNTDYIPGTYETWFLVRHRKGVIKPEMVERAEAMIPHTLAFMDSIGLDISPNFSIN